MCINENLIEFDISMCKMIPFYSSKTLLSDSVCIVSKTVYLIIVYVNVSNFLNF